MTKPTVALDFHHRTAGGVDWAAHADPLPYGPALWSLYESACTEPLASFEAAAIAQLGRLVGGDGAVWGSGVLGPQGSPVRIDSARVFDRPASIVADYARVGAHDPTPQRFFDRPDRVQAITVNDFFRGAGRDSVGEYLCDYHVHQLMLGGGRASTLGGPSDAMQWITLYRSDADKPFTADDAALYTALMPHWVQARGVCMKLDEARRNEPAPREGRRAALSAAEPSKALSKREREVLALIARGFNSEETAELLGVLVSTVRTHLQHVYAKLGVHSMTEAVYEARLSGWLD